MQSIQEATTVHRSRYANTGFGPSLQLIDIGHEDYVGLVEPETAFWSLVKHQRIAEAMTDRRLLQSLQKKAQSFADEIKGLRFDLKPSAVYFNPTDRCNLNCPYCYIPERMRRKGKHMSETVLLDALGRLNEYFRRSLPRGRRPQIVFHGAEPMLNRKAVFAGIQRYRTDFDFGIQTNGTLLDADAIDFLTTHEVSIGLSLDAARSSIADRTRRTWDGQSVFAPVAQAIKRLRGYPRWSVIATVTSQNLSQLKPLVGFLHRNEVPLCLLNLVRCTMEGARGIKPEDRIAAKYFLDALDHTFELYRQTGKKLVVANFANILLAIMAPTARRLMCDISPCGAGRCFFALAANGDLFPCSEFVGLSEYRGGNLLVDDLDSVLVNEAFQRVTNRKVEDIVPCKTCTIRHFCGAPCPAEAAEINGGLNRPGAFCEFYEEQVRYAFRIIADRKQNAFLWNDWDKGMKSTFVFTNDG